MAQNDNRGEAKNDSGVPPFSVSCHSEGFARRIS